MPRTVIAVRITRSRFKTTFASRALAHQVAEEIGNFKGDYEGLGINVHAKHAGDDDIPDET